MDICIPVQAELSLALPSGTVANPLEQARIDDATAALPEPPTADLKVTATTIDPATHSLRIAFVVPDDDRAAPEIFLAGPSGFSFGKPSINAAADGGFVADIPYRAPAKGGELKGRTALFVLRSGRRSMETSLAFE
ncbi:hypothetical protein AX761_20720 [Rhizobium sp. 58]|nr:hypothetical protein AX761_20720 [Rhizobium sp. 58]